MFRVVRVEAPERKNHVEIALIRIDNGGANAHAC